MINNKYTVRGEEREYTGGNKEVRKQRVAFMIIDGEIYSYGEEDDDRPLSVIFEEIANGAADICFEDTIRGWFDNSNICFYISSNLIPVNDLDIEDVIEEIRAEQIRRMGYKNVDIAVWSGTEVGKFGELWQPMSLRGKIIPDGRYITFNPIERRF